MKKLLLVLTVLFLSLPTFAQLEQGQHLLDIKGDLGFQIVNSGITYSAYDARADWGTLGVEIGASYYYLVSKHLGLGVDISYGDFDGGAFTWSTTNRVEDATHVLNAMLASRYTFNPDSRFFRFYIPFGGGLTLARQKIYIHYYGTEYGNKKTDTSLGLFIGAGLEFDIGQKGWSWGLESRYNTFWYDSEKLVKNAPSPIHGNGNRRYEYITFQLHISKRF